MRPPEDTGASVLGEHGAHIPEYGQLKGVSLARYHAEQDEDEHCSDRFDAGDDDGKTQYEKPTQP